MRNPKISSKGKLGLIPHENHSVFINRPETPIMNPRSHLKENLSGKRSANINMIRRNFEENFRTEKQHHTNRNRLSPQEEYPQYYESRDSEMMSPSLENLRLKGAKIERMIGEICDAFQTFSDQNQVSMILSIIGFLGQ